MGRSLHKHERACSTNTNRHVSSCWSRCQSLHKHKHARNINPLFGGSLEGCGCSRREFLEVASFVMSGTGEPHCGLGRLFVRKRTRWPHLCAPTPWSGNNRGRKPEPTTSQTKHGAPCAVDGAHGVGGVLHWKSPASSRSPSSSSLSPPSLPSCPWACPVLVSA